MDTGGTVLEIYPLKCHSTLTKGEIPPYLVTWLGLEMIMLSKISQTKKRKLHDFTCMWDRKLRATKAQ